MHPAPRSRSPKRRYRHVAVAAVCIASFACALADEGGALAGVSGLPDASDAAPPKGVDANAKIPPDPTALSERIQWVFDLRWERGDVYLVQVHTIDMGTPHPTPRMMGRFALELYEGPTLIERARFDFPMMGGVEPDDAGWKTPARFGPLLKTRIGVLFPATKRGTRLELWDRAQDKRWPLPWPPREGTLGDKPDASSAG